MANDGKREIVYEIVEKIGTIRGFPNGWTKELNMVSWNGGEAKYDIREWDEEHVHMSRGITLRPDEMQNILSLLEGRTI